MKRLWAPWRMDFIKVAKEKTKVCIFCQNSKSKDDKKNLVIYRGKKAFVMLNMFPYNNGHIMIAPYRHEDITDLSQEELTEINNLMQKFVKIFKKEYKAEGFNIGYNVGKVSGAGFEHIHMHIVPRWRGDNNFMPVISENKVLPEILETTYQRLTKALKSKK